jgi:ribose transport system permease protein
MVGIKKQQSVGEILVRIWKNYSIVVVFFIIIAICGILAPRFLQPNNLLNILRNTSIVGVIALGMTFVIIGGGIDLSSGPVMATSGAALIFMQRMVTEAGATIMGNRIIEFTRIGSGSIFGIPTPFIIAALLAFLFHFILTKTKFGTYVFAVGGNENASRYSGIKVDRIKIYTYMIVGLCAGIAATIEMSRMAAVAVTTSGSQYEFEAITAVIVGGTALSGGRGRILGTIVGFVILGIVNNMMIMLNISPYLSGAVKGSVILFAVLMQRKD